MPASLRQTKIRGIRSYSPYEHKTQCLDFMPLTLIVGANGSGKTTIIEALKFIISGDEPPLSESRRNFIHTTKNSTSAFDKNVPFASIELTFQNYRNEETHAKREIIRPIQTGKNTPTPAISSCYRIGNGPWKHVHKQDDWSQTMPTLFNLPNRAILNYVILCHQEDNLWCMGDSSSVKQIFDKIFGCEQYKKEIKHIDAEIKNCKADLSLADRDSVHLKERVDNYKAMKGQSAALSREIEKLNKETDSLDAKIRALGHEKLEIQTEISAYEKKEQEIDLCRIRIIELQERESATIKTLKSHISEKEMSDTELEKKMDEHTRYVQDTKLKMRELSLLETKLARDLEELEAQKDKTQKIIQKLQVIQLKSLDSKNSIIQDLEALKRDHSIVGIDKQDLKSSIEALLDFEIKLRENKCDQTEAEENLASKSVRLNREINKLEGNLQGLEETIKSKETFINQLKDQVAETDPLARNVDLIGSNITKMEKITKKMPLSEHVTNLIEVIDETKDIVSDVVDKVKNDTLIKINKRINIEKMEIADKKALMTATRKHKEDLLLEQKKVDEDLIVVRGATKDAHNKLVTFSSKKKVIASSYEKHKTELKFLENEKLDVRLADAKAINEKFDNVKTKHIETQTENANLSKQYAASFETFESYKTNKNLRDLKKRIEEYRDSEMALQRDLAQDEFTYQLKDKLKEIEKQDLLYRDKRSMIAGSKVRIDDELYRVKSDIENNKGVMSKYAESLGKVVCNRIIMSDLEKLKECFNQSLLTFHNQMIAKINQVLKSRWRQIYQGGDIDHIELVDEEITRTKNQKGYNYYIAMTKSGIRMKMREKGSAGQKALACIIIRMALAELFVKDFAIIALDEPTANLDLANVISLAKAIGNYVKRRAKRGFNIQWVIITHDEQFLRALDSESSPFYYRCVLDSEGCSKIQKCHYDNAELQQEFTREISVARSIKM